MDDDQPETFSRQMRTRLKEAVYQGVGAGVGATLAISLVELIKHHSLLDAARTGGRAALFLFPFLLFMRGLFATFPAALSFYRKWRARLRST